MSKGRHLLDGPLLHGHRRSLAKLKDYLVPEPVDFELWEWKLIAEVPQLGGDGHPVQIFECRCPSSFFKLVALPSKNSVGTHKLGFELQTGTGMEWWVVETALDIAEGMVGIPPEETVQ